MGKLLNVYQDPHGSFYYLITIRGHRFVEANFPTAEEAAWQCDRAKWFLNCHDLMGRKTSYNFPERIESEGESAWSVPVPGLWDFIEQCKKSLDSVAVVTPDVAALLEESRAIAQGQLDRDREVEEAKRQILESRNTDKQKVTCESLQEMVSTMRQLRNKFEALNLPKDTKERNSIQLTLGLLGQRLAQLS